MHDLPPDPAEEGLLVVRPFRGPDCRLRDLQGVHPFGSLVVNFPVGVSS